MMYTTLQVDKRLILISTTTKTNKQYDSEVDFRVELFFRYMFSMFGRLSKVGGEGETS